MVLFFVYFFSLCFGGLIETKYEHEWSLYCHVCFYVISDFEQRLETSSEQRGNGGYPMATGFRLDSNGQRGEGKIKDYSRSEHNILEVMDDLCKKLKVSGVMYLKDHPLKAGVRMVYQKEQKNQLPKSFDPKSIGFSKKEKRINRVEDYCERILDYAYENFINAAKVNKTGSFCKKNVDDRCPLQKQYPPRIGAVYQKDDKEEIQLSKKAETELKDIKTEAELKKILGDKYNTAGLGDTVLNGETTIAQLVKKEKEVSMVIKATEKKEAEILKNIAEGEKKAAGDDENSPEDKDSKNVANQEKKHDTKSATKKIEL